MSTKTAVPIGRAPRDFVGYGEAPPQVRWPGDARVAVSLVVNFEEGAERSPIYGDESMEPGGEGFSVPLRFRDLRAEAAFSYGTRCGFWRLVDIFRRHRTPASFFICGAALERNPQMGRVITGEGHEPVSHGYRWMPAYLLGKDRERRDLKRNVEVIRDLTGQRPLGHYSRGESPHTRDLIQEDGGFVYNCDTYADDLPYYVMHRGSPMLMVPYSLEINDTKFNRPTGMSEPKDLYRYLVAAYDCLHREGGTAPKMMSLGIHMRLGGRPGRAAAIEGFIKYAKAKGGAWFARRIEVARTWMAQVPPPRPGGKPC